MKLSVLKVVSPFLCSIFSTSHEEANMIEKHLGTKPLLIFILLISVIFGMTACGGQTITPPAAPTQTFVPERESNIIIVVGDSWCPYNCAPGSTHPGYIIEVATEIFKEAGYRLEYQTVPWTRTLNGVKEGIYDAAVGAAIGDIPEATFPEESLGFVQNSMFVRKGNLWKFNGIDSLKNIRLGVVGDYYYSDEINAYLEANPKSPNIDVLLGDNAVERSITKLLDNKIDMYIEDPNVFYFTAAQMGVDRGKFDIAGELNEPEGIYIAFSPKNPQSEKWAQILSAGIKEFRQSGRLAEILKWYGVKDWK